MDKHSCQVATLATGLAAALLSGCAQMPVGPTIAAMPAPGKPFEAFIADDQMCRNWAAASVGPAGRAANDQMVTATVAGALLGAAAGALGGNGNDAAAGAAIGTALGAGAGSNISAGTAWSAQRRYDIAYQQCMYARGNVIPGYYPYPVPPPR
ncbi:MAG: glycine zipper family protein [Massilia sp.]|nr:glycine zipper family protein [Massilia sp.]